MFAAFSSYRAQLCCNQSHTYTPCGAYNMSMDIIMLLTQHVFTNPLTPESGQKWPVGGNMIHSLFFFQFGPSCAFNQPPTDDWNTPASLLKSSHLVHIFTVYATYCKAVLSGSHMFAYGGIYQNNVKDLQLDKWTIFSINAVPLVGLRSIDSIPILLSFCQAVSIRWSYKVILPVYHSGTCLLIGQRFCFVLWVRNCRPDCLITPTQARWSAGDSGSWHPGSALNHCFCCCIWILSKKHT